MAKKSRKFKTEVQQLLDLVARHVVLGAHGCGAFGNPVEEVTKGLGENRLPDIYKKMFRTGKKLN